MALHSALSLHRTVPGLSPLPFWRWNRLPLLPLAAALAVATTAPATAQAQAPSQVTPRRSPGAVSVTVPSARIAGALISRPRWDVNGSSAAPPKAPLATERVVPAPAPRASHGWFASESLDTRRHVRHAISMSQSRLVRTRALLSGATPSPSPISARTVASAPKTHTPMRVVMSMEVPTSVPGRTGLPGQVYEGRGEVVTSGNAPSLGIESRRDRMERERQEKIATQKQYERAQAEKKKLELLLVAQLQRELSHAQRENRSAKADLTESVRNLDQFRGVLQRAFLDAGPDATGLHPFVQAAKRYAGTPYVWGGESRSGFDCSGFIIVVMRDLGYKALPHSAAEQFNYGMPVARGLLKPGDLVFFANTYKPGISHVGIYLGRGRFIHAAGTGKGTIVSHLAASPFAEKYAGARRLFRSKR